MKPAKAQNASIVWKLLLVVCASGVLASGAQTQDRSQPAARTSTGQATFVSACAGCHGLDGRGGERAPNIASAPKTQRLADTEIARILSQGIPGTGMPAFRSLGESRVQSVVAYLRILQGHNRPSSLPGDPARGKAVFFGKGECSSCHMMQGEGGFLGTDLSAYALTHSANEVLNAIVKPPNNKAATHVVAVTRDGGKFTGLIRNEDNFSVQLQTVDGAFHFFSRSDLQSVDYVPDPLMPGDYSKRLSQKELGDLISYVMAADRGDKAKLKSRDED